MEKTSSRVEVAIVGSLGISHWRREREEKSRRATQILHDALGFGPAYDGDLSNTLYETTNHRTVSAALEEVMVPTL